MDTKELMKVLKVSLYTGLSSTIAYLINYFTKLPVSNTSFYVLAIPGINIALVSLKKLIDGSFKNK